MKVLVTGFEPFGGEEINPSWEAAKQLDGKRIGEIEVKALEMPVGWEKIKDAIVSAIEEYQPDAVICVGQAGGRAQIAIERVAVNRANGKDNYDVTRSEDLIAEDGPDAYLSTLPIVEMKNAMCEAGIPAYISNTAGLYLCNCIFYTVRHYIESNGLSTKAGFIHIPYIPEQVARKKSPNTPSMALNMIVKGLEVAIDQLSLLRLASGS